MISVEQALRIVNEQVVPMPAQRLSAAAAHGHILAEQIVCTLDSPPHDKALVDGYAVRAADVDDGMASPLRILEEVTAGQVPTAHVQPRAATRIMTGAPIPMGADAVVMIEKTESMSIDGVETVRILEPAARAGQNVMRRGESMRSGDVVLSPGHRLRGIELGLLAELGVAEVAVMPVPTVAIISTGDELVPTDETPAAGQIRNSNGPMLESLVREAGGMPRNLGIVRDTEALLAVSISRGLNADVLLLSGGVSVGVLDLVPLVLKQLGVEEVFHKVHLKPGKPLWFGVRRGTDRNTLVFGLPGNPVSGLVCFHLFVRPALLRLAGQDLVDHRPSSAQLAGPFRHRSDRPTYYPGRIASAGTPLIVEPLPWRGSADLRTLVDAQLLLCFEPGDQQLQAGDSVMVRWL